MIEEKVFQKTRFICDKCKKETTVETELYDEDGYEKISEFTPDGFEEIEDLNILLCDNCKKALKDWIKGK